MSESKMVYAAISRVMAQVAKVGIGKTRENTQQHFMFRGVDDVYNTLSPILAENKLIILPRATERIVVERDTKSGGKSQYVTVKVDYDFISAEDGSIHTACGYGEASDSGDKATGKAMSMAYKTVCFEAFCIPIEGNDADEGADSVWENQVADFLAAMDSAEDVDAAKRVYKDALPFCKKREDVEAAKRLKAKLLEKFPEAKAA